VVKYVKISLLFVISCIGLFYAFKSIELAELLDHLYSVNLFKFSISILILIVACIIRAKRLKYLALPMDESISTHHLFGATMIGYFGNGILFFRLGELLKAYAISQGREIKPSESFGLIMLERLVDAVSVFFLLVVALPFLPLDDKIIRYWIIAFIVVTILFTGVLVVLNFLDWKFLINQLGFLNKTLREKIVDVITKIYDGLGLVFKTKKKTEILSCTILIWLCYFLMTKWLIESCHIELDLFDSFIMLILGAIIISVPALPGGLGTYEAGITYAFTFLFFVSKDIALTYAIVSHTSNYLPYIIIGFFYFIRSGVKISSVKNNELNHD
jgi:hypothetical protein